MKNTMTRINSKSDITEQKISKFEDLATENRRNKKVRI